ncbi:MAG TPA: hypothetical protein VHG29_05175 [Novosphingobium sp.]|nr:hypothetical protein [Novosphingobium sp.]
MSDPVNTAADRLSRRRARMLPMFALIFLAQQASYFSQTPGERLVDHVRIGAWVMMVTVLLALLVTGGFWFRSPAVRALMEDDVARANRASAITLGFVSAMLASIIIYVFEPRFPLTAREAIHLIVSAGLATALIRFGLLERRALG